LSAAKSDESYACALAPLAVLELWASVERGVAVARSSAPSIAEQATSGARAKCGVGDEIIDDWVMSSIW
jgi:hypothetical protein